MPSSGDIIFYIIKEYLLSAYSGEIFGIAGIAGNGQDELMEVLIGEWRSSKNGLIRLNDIDLTGARPSERRIHGIGFIPEERNGHGAISSMTLSENTLLTDHSLEGNVQYSLINFSQVREKSTAIANTFDVRLPDENPPASALSGGNLQKFVVGREIIKAPKVLIVAQPTWGVDVGAAVFIRKAMLELANNGSAIIVISQDLEEIFAISHRVAVLHNGMLSEPMWADELTLKKLDF